MTPIQRAVRLCGGPTKTARLLGVTQQAVRFWRDGERQFPVEKCSLLEQLTGGKVTRQQLRPHDWPVIWPELAAKSVEHSMPIGSDNP